MFLTKQQTKDFLEYKCCPACEGGDLEENEHPTGGMSVGSDVKVQEWDCVDCGAEITVVWSKDGVSVSFEEL